MAKAKKKTTTKVNYANNEITVKTKLSADQLLSLALNTPIKKKGK